MAFSLTASSSQSSDQLIWQLSLSSDQLLLHISTHLLVTLVLFTVPRCRWTAEVCRSVSYTHPCGCKRSRRVSKLLRSFTVNQFAALEGLFTVSCSWGLPSPDEPEIPGSLVPLNSWGTLSVGSVSRPGFIHGRVAAKVVGSFNKNIHDDKAVRDFWTGPWLLTWCHRSLYSSPGFHWLMVSFKCECNPAFLKHSRGLYKTFILLLSPLFWLECPIPFPQPC